MIYRYWEMTYISCESNTRYTHIRTPDTWDQYDVRSAVPMGGCGDDIAEIVDIEESIYDDYTYDFE
jgi:hypothetical protein